MSERTVAIVSAFVDPMVELVQRWLGIDARAEAIAFSRELDPAPAIAVTVEAFGGLRGGVTWTFSEELARAVAARLLAIDPRTADAETCAAASAELANIVTGSATAALLEAGYRVEIRPPVVHPHDAPRCLAEHTHAVTVRTGGGDARVLVAIKEAP